MDQFPADEMSLIAREQGARFAACVGVSNSPVAVPTVVTRPAAAARSWKRINIGKVMNPRNALNAIYYLVYLVTGYLMKVLVDEHDLDNYVDVVDFNVKSEFWAGDPINIIFHGNTIYPRNPNNLTNPNNLIKAMA